MKNVDNVEVDLEIESLVLRFVLKREALRMSRKELSKRCGVGIDPLCKIEAFTNKPSLTALLKIYHALNMELKVVDNDEA